MGLSLLAPFFLAGLLAVAVPVLVHLTDRERRDVVRFPSLRFLTRLPFRSTKRQRIRHPLLFALRVLALVLLALAFSRPFLDGAAPVAGAEAGREVVFALDRSYSMGYGDAWERAVARTRDVLAGLGAGTRVSLVTFAETAEVAVAPTADRAVLARALDVLAPGSGGTRYAPALALANEVLLEATPGGREVVLVSDFQARGWDRSDTTRLVAGAALTAIDVAAAEGGNAMVAGAEARPAESGGGPAFTIDARLVNHGADALGDLPVTVTAEGREAATVRVALPASAGAAVRLGPLPLPSPAAGAAALAEATRVAVRAAPDLLAADDVFYLTVSPRAAVPVLLVEARDARDDGTLYLRQAFAIADEPAFAVVTRPVDRVRPEDVESARLVILHDCPAPGGAAGRTLVDHVTAGGGLWVVAGGRTPAFPDEVAALLPAGIGETVDRLDAQGVSLAGVDYDHPVFEIFSGPDDGNVSAPRYYRYRPLAIADDEASVLARYTDGAVALAERRLGDGRRGDGRVLVSGAPLDNRWSNLPVQPVFVPFVHRVSQYLTGEGARQAWRTVGDVLDLRAVLAETGAAAGVVTVESPSGRREEIDTRNAEPRVRLDEAGFYEIRGFAGEGAAYPVAVNVDRAESDLTRLDTEAFVAASTSGAAGPAPAAASETLTRDERERRQGVWWFLVLGALLILAVESTWSNRYTVYP